MKIIICIIFTLCLGFKSYAQEVYTARKGSKFFPGHLHVVIKVDSAEIHYQLFDHWYSWSYAQLRDVRIPTNELDKYGEQNDTLTILTHDKKVRLVDGRYKLDRKIKHQNLCASSETMREISYANSIAEKHKDMKHFHLYEREDLELSEEDFKNLVDANLAEELRKRAAKD